MQGELFAVEETRGYSPQVSGAAEAASDDADQIGPPPTIGAAIHRLTMEPSSPDRAAKLSALRRLCDFANVSPQDASTQPEPLRALISSVSPSCAGVTDGRWRSIKSVASRALRELGVDVLPGRSASGLGDEWNSLLASAPRKIKLGLSRLAHFADSSGILPNDVTVETFAAFKLDLNARSLKAKPSGVHRQAVSAWNAAVQGIEGWPSTLISAPRHERYYSMEWGDFPPSFVADVESFLEHKEKPDLLADDYAPPVRASTVTVRRRQIRQLATGLVSGGRPVQDIHSLRDLVEPENARLALRFMLDRHGGESSSAIHGFAYLLVTIARHWVKEQNFVAQLTVFATQLKVKKPGMTKRNRERLRQFDNEANTRALLLLPANVFERLPIRGTVDVKDAREAMWALATELLTVAPMRISNLVSLDVTRHLVVIGRGTERRLYLVIPAEEVKNNEDIEVLLPEGTLRLFDRWMKRYRPVMLPGESRFLFPGRSGGPRRSEAFSTSLGKFIIRHAGVQVHSHLFRHLVGKFHLKAHPHDVETVRRVLGHRSTATTLRAYVSADRDTAVQRYDATIQALRRAPAPRIDGESRQ